MSTIKVDTIATRTGSGNITASNTIAGTSATLSGTLAVTGNTTMGGTAAITGNTTVSGTLTSTGKITSTAGITFGSDTAAANVLDDYEEGTFTPSVTFTGGAPSAGATTGFGTYQKIGNMVYAHLKASNINVNGASGDIQIQNMPFTARLDTDMDAFEGTCAVGQIATIGYCTSSILDNTSNCRIMESGNTTSEFRDVITTSECNHGASDFFIHVAYPVS